MSLLMLFAALAATDVNPDATALFDRDPALNRWALAAFDANKDGWLTLYEAQSALGELKRLADSNGDGRVTVAEYEETKSFLVARFNLASTAAR